MDKYHKIYKGFVIIPIVIIILGINSIIGIIGWGLLLLFVILDNIKGYIKRNRIITSIHTNINNDIKFREVYKTTEIAGIISAIISIFSLKETVHVDFISKNQGSIYNFIDFFYKIEPYERLMIITFVTLILFGVYSFIESLINLAKVTDEGLIFTDGTYVKYSDMKKIDINKSMFYIGDKKKIIKIKYGNYNDSKEIVVQGENVKKMEYNLEKNTSINLETSF
ncbi:hypothetical protein [Paraclostridium bifermentans]|uniref:hypothetical protein n=1 Tax=Paraclostridium bifermentans TaxID=1490 RepID=UPI00359CA801